MGKTWFVFNNYVHSPISLTTTGDHLNLSFCLQVIKRLPHKFFKRIHSTYKKSSSLRTTTQSTLEPPSTMVNLPINLQLCQALCYQAFLDELKPRQTIYKLLIRMLIKELRLMKHYTDGIAFNEIREHSQHFKMIKM